MPFNRDTRTALDRRREREADITFDMLYVQPLGQRGLHLVHPIHGDDGETIIVGTAMGEMTFKPGSVVIVGSNSGKAGKVILGLPPPGRRGASQWGVFSPADGEVDAVGIISADPATVTAGESDVVVTLTGYGFRETPVDTFTAVVYDEDTRTWTADPLVTIHDATFATTTEVTIQVDVSASAPNNKKIHVLPTRS